jgi:hypothetical protein
MEAVKKMRALHKAAGGRKLRVPPRVRAPKGVFNPGTLSVTIGPPYDYQWTWTAASGSPGYNTETAERNAGDRSFSLLLPGRKQRESPDLVESLFRLQLGHIL